MPQLARRHHFVPIFYLAGFLGEDSGRLWVCDKYRGKTWTSSPDDAALEKDLYLLRHVSGDWTDVFERELSRIEGEFATDLRRLLSTRRLPSGAPGMAKLLQFVGMLHFRTPTMQAKLNQSGSGATARRLVEDFNNGGFHRETHQRTGRAPTADEIRNHQQAVEALAAGKIRMKMNPSLWIEMLTEAMNKHSANLAFRRWSIINAIAGSPDFVCSDTPATLSVRKPELYPLGAWPGILSEHTWMLVPLDRRSVLVGSFEDNHPRGPADAMQVGFINRLMIENATRFVYSASEEIAWRRGNRLHGTAELPELTPLHGARGVALATNV